MILDQDQNPNKEPTVLLRWQWAPSQWSTAGLGMPCLQGRPLTHEIAQLHVLSAGHAFSEKLPHYPATAYVQKTCTHSTHILNFTAQKLIWLKVELKWVAMQCSILAFVWHRQPGGYSISVCSSKHVHGCLLSSKVWQFRLTVPDGMYESP